MSEDIVSIKKELAERISSIISGYSIYERVSLITNYTFNNSNGRVNIRQKPIEDITRTLESTLNKIPFIKDKILIIWKTLAASDVTKFLINETIHSTPEEAVNELFIRLSIKNSKKSRFTKLEGFILTSQCKISDSITLWPENQLPDYGKLDNDIGKLGFSLLEYPQRPGFFIEQQYSIEKVFISEEEKKDNDFQYLDKTTQNIFSACILSCADLPLFLSYHYDRFHDKGLNILQGLSPVTSKWHDVTVPRVPFMNRELKIPRISQIFSSLETILDDNFTFEVYQLSKMITKARCYANFSQKALEYTSILEFLLTKENNNDPSAIITDRAAWILGKNPDERTMYQTTIRHLYTARNHFAHGKINKKLKAHLKNAVTDSDTIIIELIYKFIKNGSLLNNDELNKLAMGHSFPKFFLL